MSRFGEEDEYFESNNFSGGEGSQAEEVDDHENDNESDKKQVKKVVKVRTVVRKPQIKLDPSRVCGDRGLKCLMKNFEKFKTKEGREFTDLNNMVSQYEYWAHRLYPRMKFKDVIERLEKLGEKREIRAQLHALRMGVDENQIQDINEDPTVEDERMTEQVMRMMNNIQTSDDDDEDENNEKRNNLKPTAQINLNDSDDDDALFEKLLSENRI